MAENPSLVRVGLQGFAYIGAVGATEPAKITDDPASDWDADDWSSLGLITEDGLSENVNQEQKEFYAWGHLDAPVRVINTRTSFSFQMSFEETNVPVLEAYFGITESDFTNVAAVSSGEIAPQQLKFNSASSGSPSIRALGIDIIDGDSVIRYIMPRAQVSERGNLVHRSDDMTVYQMTFTPLLDFTGGSSVSVKRFISNLALPA